MYRQSTLHVGVLNHQCAHNTPATGGERRESNRADSMDGDY